MCSSNALKPEPMPTIQLRPKALYHSRLNRKKFENFNIKIKFFKSAA